MSKSNLTTVGLLAALYILRVCGCAYPALASSTDAPGANGSSFQPPPAVATAHAAPFDCKLYCPPALLPNAPAWVTVETQQGRPIANVSVLVNGVPGETNLQGRAAFTVPNAGGVSLSLRTADGQEIQRSDYTLLTDGVLSWTDAAAIVGKLIGQRRARFPQLLYAPSVVEAAQQIAILGDGFDGRPDRDRVVLDGVGCEPICGSACSLLVDVPDRIAPGALKQIYVATVRGDTQTLETDVARARLEWSKDLEKTRSEVAGRVYLEGTALAALVAVDNSDQEGLSIKTSDGQSVGEHAVLILPGGDENQQTLTALRNKRRRLTLAAHLLDGEPELTDRTATTTALPASTRLTLDYAMLVKLKRRLLSIEDRQAHSRLLATVAPDTSAQREKMAAEQQALSSRHTAAATMLAARRALFAAHGGSIAQAKQAIDDAAGGAYFVLESQVRKFTIVADSPQVPLNAETPAKKPAAYFLPEPKFKLWPPVDSVPKQSTVTTDEAHPAANSSGGKPDRVAGVTK